jgi:hypothetical protein
MLFVLLLATVGVSRFTAAHAVHSDARALLNRRFRSYGSGGNDNPGLSVALSNAGLEYARSIGVPVLEDTLRKTVVPDQSGDSKGIEWSVNSMEPVNVDFGQNSITVSNAGGVQKN